MRRFFQTICCVFVIAFATPATAADIDARQLTFFESKIRPLLDKHCFECHSARAKQIKGGLRLDSRQALLLGGDSGVVVVPGKPDESLLIEAVHWKSLEMPPRGKLAEDRIAALVSWIEAGAPWPVAETPPRQAGVQTYDWDKLQIEHWAFRPVAQPALPQVKHAAWPRNEIDFFVLDQLEAAGMEPARPAAAQALVRRIYFDLIGLPPTPREIDRWSHRIEATPDDGIRELTECLLDSPHYGERWGRHWLDVARYSDGSGGFLDRAALPGAWRFRDWVVTALNADMPYDRFVQLQIAGDLLDPPGGAIATGFFALGPTYHSDGGDPESVAQAKSETLDDRIDTMSRGFLALTVSCARCHAHKFDPIPQLDYYSLAGVFNNTTIREVPLAPPAVVQVYNDHQQSIQGLQQQVKQLADKLKKEKREATDGEKSRQAKWIEEIQQLKRAAPVKYDVAHGLTDSGTDDMRLAIRGDLRKPGEMAPRRFLRILSRSQRPLFKQGSGRRDLAEAIVDSDNPLTARVLVNRVWMHHFGQGLVRTPSNFGILGQPPTHPRLLDWLTADFTASGWSLKHLHRKILLSMAYRMSSESNERGFSQDGDNRLLWRMNPRRMDVEAWRDALLAVTGELDRSLGGPPTENVNGQRRTLYFKVSRNGDRFASDEFLRLFDFPLMRATVARRPTSIVPQQYLFMMNSPFMLARARALSTRLHHEAPNDKARIELAYRLLYGRRPRPEERQLGLDYLSSTESVDIQTLTIWQRYAQVLLSSNEFMQVQ